MDLTLDTSADDIRQAQRQRADSVAPPLKGDRMLWGIYAVLCFISMVELYSASSQEVSASGSFGVYSPIIRHTIQLFGGFLIILFIQRQSYAKFFFWGPMLALISVLLMLGVYVFGEEVNGARRSLNLIVLSVYPSELLKLSAAIIIALIMARSHAKAKDERRKRNGVITAAAVIVLLGGVLITQGLTNALLLMGISLAMMVIGGVRYMSLLKVLLIYIIGAIMLLGIKALIDSGEQVTAPTTVTTSLTPEEQKIFATQNSDQSVNAGGDGAFGRSGTWIARLKRFFNSDGVPKYEQPITDLNRQEMRGYMAQAHGGLRGVGVGNSRETARLPLAFSDYIYSIIIEEWGLWGGLFVMFLYLCLLARASSIASRCNQRFAALLVIGMAVMIVLQALFHMAIVTGCFPVSGQPLPLISKGGTSILTTSIAFGIMLSVSRFGIRTGRRQDERDEQASIPENFRSANPNQLK